MTENESLSVIIIGKKHIQYINISPKFCQKETTRGCKWVWETLKFEVTKLKGNSLQKSQCRNNSAWQACLEWFKFKRSVIYCRFLKPIHSFTQQIFINHLLCAFPTTPTRITMRWTLNALSKLTVKNSASYLSSYLFPLLSY